MTHSSAGADSAPRPDDPARRQRQCVGKRGYLDPTEAKAQAKAMHKKFKAKFSAYECQWCNLYHVGTDRSTAQAQRRAAAAAGYGGASE